MSIAKKRLGLAAGAVALVGMVGLSVVPAHSAETCAMQLKAVKASLDKASAGPKKDKAAKYYTEAVAAEKKKDEKTCLADLSEATVALK
jgi:hypothetical protein